MLDVPRVATAMHTFAPRGYPTRPHSVRRRRVSIDGTFYAERVESADMSSQPVRHPVRASIITYPVSSARCGRSIAPFICLASRGRCMQSDYSSRAKPSDANSVINLTMHAAKIDKDLLRVRDSS